MDLSGKTPFNVMCEKCKHIWTALYTPMPMADAARILKSLRCPVCASTSADHFATDQTP
jgi:hypothetical protein